ADIVEDAAHLSGSGGTLCRSGSFGDFGVGGNGNVCRSKHRRQWSASYCDGKPQSHSAKAAALTTEHRGSSWLRQSGDFPRQANRRLAGALSQLLHIVPDPIDAGALLEWKDAFLQGKRVAGLAVAL